MRNETIAAQNILESYTATDIGRVIQGIKNHVTPFAGIAGSVRVFTDTGGVSTLR
jgi:hypothetical protein